LKRKIKSQTQTAQGVQRVERIIFQKVLILFFGSQNAGKFYYKEVLNMQVQLQGIRALDFKSDNGENVKGTQLFVTYNDESVNGLMTDKIFVKQEVQIPQGIKQNDILNLMFNNKGKVIAISQAKQ